jgi:hypothetical protein
MMIDIKSLKHAIVLQEKIEALKAELDATLGGAFISGAPAKRRGRPAKGFGVDAGADTIKPRKKRKMSAEGRARIVAAQKARWAAVKKGRK